MLGQNPLLIGARPQILGLPQIGTNNGFATQSLIMPINQVQGLKEGPTMLTLQDKYLQSTITRQNSNTTASSNNFGTN